MEGGPEHIGGIQIGRVTLDVIRGDITDLKVDAIVNAANDHLWMGSGVAGAIKRRGGVEIEREAMANGPVQVGSAIATGAGALGASYVIHAAVMGQDLNTDQSIVAKTTRAVLDLAIDMGLASIAMPLMGTGVGGLPPDGVAGVMVGSVKALASSVDVPGMRVVIVGYDETSAKTVMGCLGAP